MSFVDLQKVLWDSYDVAIEMGMTEDDARVWALNKMMENNNEWRNFRKECCRITRAIR